MKILVGVLALLAMGAGLACARGSGEAADQAAIAALWVEYGQSRADGDAGRWLAIHDQAALKMPQDGPMFRIADVSGTLQAAWAKQDEGYSLEMHVEPQEIVVLGDYAYSMGTYTKRTVPKGGGEPALFEGKFLTILRKDAEGKWIIYRDCYNSSTPTAAPASAQYSFGTPVNLGPRINSAQTEGSPRVSADGLELYFNSNRPGGHGGADIWVATRPTVNAEWGEAVNLGPLVNSSANEIAPAISADGLELYFETDRPGGLGSDDLWVARRTTRSDDWGAPVWLGKAINAEGMDHCPNITFDGLTLFFDSNAAGKDVGDLMVTRRATLRDNWGPPVNLGRGLSSHFASSISSDGNTLYFASAYPGGSGGNDIWQVPIRLNGRPVSK